MKISNNYNSPNFTSLTTTLGKAIKKGGNIPNKIIKGFEPNFADNSFCGLTGIMVGAVLIPRIITAAKRNPDNKEATWDEIKEILYRDVQTILIMLFGLKILNSGVGNIATKLSGIPMIEEPLIKIFNNNSKGLKGICENATELFKHPIKYGKEFVKNIGKIIHPTGGSILSTGEQINSRFTNLNNYREIKTLLDETVPTKGGDGEKVFRRIINSLIKKQDEFIALKKASALAEGKEPDLANLEEIREKLQKMLDKDGFKNFMEEGSDKEIERLMVNFFSDENNDIARSARNVKDWLRMLALGIEVTYLGFGLPALNQKRLKKKYLSEKPVGTTTNGIFNPINDKYVKAQEVKLYSQFMK